ncbi:DUF6301 family protein [Nocardia sp. NPDC055321]
MRIDIDRVARIAATAAEFDWTWRPADLPRFCSETGWKIAAENARSARLVTDMTPDRPTATASYGSYPSGDRSDAGLRLEYLSIVLTETEDLMDERVTALRKELEDAIGAQLGTHAVTRRGAEVPTWGSPRARISLHADSRSIALDVVNPRYFDRTGIGVQPSFVTAGYVRDNEWTVFADALAWTLWRLPAPSYLIVHASGGRFAQFAVVHDELSAEISSNTWLEPEFRMTDSEEIRMTELGWLPYSEEGCPNWYHDVAFPAGEPDFAASARRAVTTLREVFHRPGPSGLRVEAWTVETRLVPDLTALLTGRIPLS